MESSYITSAQKAEQLPELGPPEIAFVGRSNCGKSTLLNALLERVKLARASNTPGRTQMVNFFAVDEGTHRVILADLPGYGYSAIGKDVRHHWQDLVDAYLKRKQIHACLFLIDIRRAPTAKEEDMTLLAQLASRRHKAPVIVVLTKADKVSNSEATLAISAFTKLAKKAKIKVSQVTCVSTLKKRGIDELREQLLTPLLNR